MALNQQEDAIITEFVITRGKADSTYQRSKGIRKVIWGAALRWKQCWEWSLHLLIPLYMNFIHPTQLISTEADHDACVIAAKACL